MSGLLARLGCRAVTGLRPAARSAVSATIAEVTPGTPRTASSAALRTPSQRWTSAASTLIEKNTFPSLTTMSESVPVAGSGVPSGDFTVESRSSTAALAAGIALLLSSAAARTDRAGQHRTLARSVNAATHRIRPHPSGSCRTSARGTGTSSAASHGLRSSQCCRARTDAAAASGAGAGRQPPRQKSEMNSRPHSITSSARSETSTHGLSPGADGGCRAWKCRRRNPRHGPCRHPRSTNGR